jgi:mannose-6-phosphate isomerase-like protein (cupin superfamily)
MPASAPDAAVNLASEIQSLDAHWTPKHVLTVNGSHSLKVASIQGEFIWHAHPDTDELFYCVSGGPMRLELADTETNDETRGAVVSVPLKPGDVYCVSKGRRHRPIAPNETGILMVEKVGTVNTGDEQASDAGKARTVHVNEGKE